MIKPRELDHTRQVYLSGYFGAGNFGDELGLRALYSSFSGMGYKVVFAAHDPAVYDGDLHASCISKRSRIKRIVAIYNSDIVLSGPGGIFKRPGKKLWWSMVVTSLWDPIIAAILSKKVAVFGVSCAQSMKPLDGFLLRKCMAGNLLFSRDQRSTGVFKSHRINAFTSSDILFMVDPVSLGSPKVDEKLRILIAPSASDMRNGGPTAFELAKAILTFIEKHGMSSVEILGVACQPEDLDHIDKINNHGVQIDRTLDWRHGDPLLAVSDLHSNDIVISQRFHAALLSAIAGLRVYVIGHDPKLEDLATTILPKVIFPLNNADIGGKEQANQFEASSGIAEGLHQDIRDNFVTMIDMTAVSYTHLTLPTTPYV